MKSYRFYLEYPSAKDKRRATRTNLGEHSGAVIAVYLPTKIEQYYINKCFECASGVYEAKNPPVCWGSVDPNYLKERCKRIPERLVKDIHPRLMEYLTEYKYEPDE